jgi:hypothetical protein
MSITNKLILTLTLLLLAATAFSREQKNAELKDYFPHKTVSQKRVSLTIIGVGAVYGCRWRLSQRDAN